MRKGRGWEVKWNLKAAERINVQTCQFPRLEGEPQRGVEMPQKNPETTVKANRTE
jgi:hypothetical protein